MAAGNHSLGTIRGTIKIDYDGAGIVKADADVKKTTTNSEKLDNVVNKIGTTFLKAAKAAAIMGASSLALHSSLQLVAATIAVLAPLAAAAFATVPGLIAGGIAALVVFRVAIIGIADALKAASGDAKEFDEAIKGLSPSARAFAVAYRNALAVLKPLQQAIQNAFFGGTAAEVTRIARAALQLKTQAVGVATAMNGVVRQFAQWASSRNTVQQIGAVLAGVRDFINAIRPALVPVAAAFLGLATQASGFGKTFGETVGAVLQRFAVFLQGVDLGALFQTALPILQSLGVFLQNAMVIASQLFGIFNVDGASAAGILGALAGQLAAFLQSAQGQAALAALGTAMQAISGAAGQIFLALLTALAPAIVALAPGITTLAGQISGLLVPVINALNPALVALAGFLSDNMGWLGPLAGVVLAAAAAYRIYTAASKAVAAVKALEIAAHAKDTAGWISNTAAIVANRVAATASLVAMNAMRVATVVWTAVQWALNLSMYGFPLVWIIAAILAVIAIIVLIATKTTWFQDLWKVVWTAIKTAASAVADWFTGSLVPALVGAWDAIVGAFQAAYNFIRPVINLLIAGFQAWWTAVSAVLSGVIAVFQAAFGIISAVIQTAWAIISAVFAVWRTVMAAVWGPILSALSTAFSAAFNFIQSVVSTVINFIVGFITFYFNLIKGIITTAVTAWVNVFRAVWGSILGFILPIIQAIASWIQTKFNEIRTIIAAVMAAVGSVISSVLNTIQAVWNTAWNTVKSVASTVWNAIRSVISSVINAVVSVVQGAVSRIVAVFDGIKAIVNTVRNFFNQLKAAADGGTGTLLAFVRTIPGKVVSALGNLGGMLYDKGRAMIQGFIDGIKDMVSAAGRAAKSVVDKVTGFFPGSPAKEGPLSGKGWTPYRGRAMMEGFAEGIIRATQIPIQATLGAMTGVTGAMNQRGSTGNTGLSTTTVNRGVSVEAGAVVVNAPQNMNPNEVGAAVATRLVMGLATGATSTVGG